MTTTTNSQFLNLRKQINLCIMHFERDSILILLRTFDGGSHSLKRVSVKENSKTTTGFRGIAEGRIAFEVS